MFKILFALVRGAAAAAEGEVVDRSALLILDRQIRDAATAVDRGKRALAVAVAHDEAEGKRLEVTLARIADLEERAVAALAGGREDLASQTAESIAMMEAARSRPSGRQSARRPACVPGPSIRQPRLEGAVPHYRVD
jgi:phage shock protein A